MQSLTDISPEKLAQLAEEGSVDLIDVRTPVEFREVHAPMAQNIPLDTLEPSSIVNNRNGSDSQPLYFVCRSGTRSAQACRKMIDAGYPDVIQVRGGMSAWSESNLPVVRGKKAMSLERQVRIVAGFLVLVGGVLAMTVHPYFAALSALVGAGLAFAGITDTCGMGMLLAKMPWNQVRATDQATCSR